MAHFNLYNDQVTAWANPYIRINDVEKETFADMTNETEATSVPWADSILNINYNSFLGFAPVTLPSWLVSGYKDILVYDSSMPLQGDPVLLRITGFWDNRRQLFKAETGGDPVWLSSD